MLNLLRNILYVISSIALFFMGVIVYGILLNLDDTSLAEAMKEKGLDNLDNVHLIVDRGNYRIDLYSDTVKVKTYKAVFGQKRSRRKESMKDLVTPIGEYFICSFDTTSKYHKFLRLSYPNEEDASYALMENIITRSEYLAITNAVENMGCPPDTTGLGGSIGIHGIGEYDMIFRNLPFIFNWTNGPIAVSNRSIDELYACADIGTKVTIKY